MNDKQIIVGFQFQVLISQMALHTLVDYYKNYAESFDKVVS